MKILLIAFTDSIHTARWINQIIDQNWEIYLYPSNNCPVIHSEIKYKIIYSSLFIESIKLIKIINNNKKENKQSKKNNSFIFRKARVVKYRFYKLFFKIIAVIINIIQKIDKIININNKNKKNTNYNYRKSKLLKIIKKYKFDIIHSLETQHAGYMTLDVKKEYKCKFPTWIHTNWGSDIFLFGHLNEHKQRIKNVLKYCDYYSCECRRDAVIARKFGFKGKILPVFPNTGGFNIDRIYNLKIKGKTSDRKIIMIKGYQGWAGRCIVGLRALERCVDLLKEYIIIVYLATSEEVKIKAELLSVISGIHVKVISERISHEEILRLHGQARISIGLSISDAISTSLLEAMAMGSFPIQSWTSCADEWIEDGKTGILVPPEDPEIIEKAIRRALTNDKLVDNAAKKNWELVKQKLDENLLKQKTVDLYKTVYNKR